MNEPVSRKNGGAGHVRFGCFPSLLLTILCASAAAGETGLTIPRTMLKEALARLAEAKIKVELEDDADPKNIILNVDTKDSKRAREAIVRAEVVERIRDAN